jgi:hypothetical protein
MAATKRMLGNIGCTAAIINIAATSGRSINTNIGVDFNISTTAYFGAGIIAGNIAAVNIATTAYRSFYVFCLAI